MDHMTKLNCYQQILDFAWLFFAFVPFHQFQGFASELSDRRMGNPEFITAKHHAEPGPIVRLVVADREV